MPSTRPCCPFERLTLPMRLSAPRTLIAREHMPRAPAPLIEGDLTARSRRDCAPLPPVCLAGLDVRQRRSDNAFVHVQAGGGARGQVSLQRCVPAYLTSHVPLRTSHASLAASCDAVARRPSRRIHAVWRVGLTPARARARATLPQAGPFVTKACRKFERAEHRCTAQIGSHGQGRTDSIARIADRTARIGSIGPDRSDQTGRVSRIGKRGSDRADPVARIVAWIGSASVGSDLTDRHARIWSRGSQIRPNGSDRTDRLHKSDRSRERWHSRR